MGKINLNKETTVKTLLGQLLTEIAGMIGAIYMGYLNLTGAIIILFPQFIGIIAAYFNIPMGGTDKLAVVLLNSIRTADISEEERDKLEMILKLGVDRWDKVNTLLAQAKENGKASKENTKLMKRIENLQKNIDKLKAK